ncbi:hypothetical protein TBLA_0B04510 [Henningerozyma blattae CBS 6284]|uniref:Alkaline ceramidase n=1 Tax=Henningerozyma blattae (strain ATCC 34711 / CBS 6284 / DSM 70876 / NBRC 10599 / NRRL Y-10934 / UCD 77-7) TaxID=1071380 RepID=I2GYT5_HENB6|nr:hypothetical protein TBLA_0B04510 [Tetrapisispora blattae CBS 6284]CCH59287.1 hypothetical protein TBLA_0B04510 [Tetrapisispora blattae CBS 6284]
MLSVPYPDPATRQLGYWGPVSSTIDWCEQNYVVSKYIAEWSNTLSNLAYLFVSLHLIRSAFKLHLESRFIIMSLGFALVGIGSWWFHMTLLYHYQLLDELPMIYATAIPTWSMVSELLIAKNKRSSISPRFIEISLALFLTFLIVALTYIYLVFKTPIIHQFVYALLNASVVFTSNYLTYYHVPRYLRYPLYRCMILGTILFAIGFICWNLDIHLCPLWIYYRTVYLNLPWGTFLEFHAWWHIFTAVGVYYYVIFLQYLRSLTHSKNATLIWRYSFIPDLVPWKAELKEKDI